MCQPYVVFEGQVAGTKARDMRLDAVYNSAMDKLMGTNGVPHSGHRADLWYEFVVTLQNGYCHPGGVLQVTFSGASAATAWCAGSARALARTSRSRSRAQPQG